MRAVECGFADLVDTYHVWELANLLAKGMDIEDLETIALDILAKNFIEFTQNAIFMTEVTGEFLARCLERNILAAILPEEEGEAGGDGGAKGNAADADGTSGRLQALSLSEERTKREHKVG